ncbi:hypothetical protein ATANTOWER_028324 [Ataeniobius toweri]|uniref:Uncharacterized protein n=1 Tax=Ataeniobius toweri TaxID=208326 RepID=A0ABU7BYR0_9TELE|nr:hypothetical protein [Ataeniobius toweri]
MGLLSGYFLDISIGTSAPHAGSGPEGPGDQPGVLAESPLPPALRPELRTPGLSWTKKTTRIDGTRISRRRLKKASIEKMKKQKTSLPIIFF